MRCAIKQHLAPDVSWACAMQGTIITKAIVTAIATAIKNASQCY
jgi:hypothetical protein